MKLKNPEFTTLPRNAVALQIRLPAAMPLHAGYGLL